MINNEKLKENDTKAQENEIKPELPKTEDQETPKDEASRIRRKINQKVNSHQIVIFAKSDCPYGKLVLQAMTNLKIGYLLIELDEHLDGHLLTKEL